MSRPLLLTLVGLAVGAGVLATDAATASRAASAAGEDLIRLLRFMAAIKAAMAVAAVGVAFWRLGEPVPPGRFVGYGLACAAMAAGPGLIWGMAHVGPGALLLHGGLLATVLLLWRDPAVATRLQAMLAARRARRPGGPLGRAPQ